MRTNIYIDGFNLYNGALKRTPYKWLDVRRVCELLLPDAVVHTVHYFTARIKPLPDDPDGPVRQNAYLRALATLPGIAVHFGQFVRRAQRMPLVAPLPGAPDFAEVWRTEEKGSDVNLAVQLVHDAHLNRFDQAAVVSNDSDLLAALRIARRELGKRVGVINPHKHPSKELLKEADFVRQVREGVLGAAQLPDEIRDAHGVVRKPASW